MTNKDDLQLVALRYAGLNDTTERVRALIAAEPNLSGVDVLARLDGWVREAYEEVQRHA
ncbi:hypothetical protein [Streptomyces sp. NPDC006459]|uniref:hypothetical protein n=1 Tax=Streptomyces sp. NPDC006459 TaxID=3154303 RepID=UPI0033BE1A9A